MERSIEDELKKWKESPVRYPLLLRGARQVGKTYIIEKLGKTFESFEMVNLEAQPEAIGCFETLNPLEIIQKLELLTKRPIRPKKTLLFIDEIQASPQAIISLRYFKEKLPDLHVIAAGSLLEFTLAQKKFSFPVGRVQFIYLRPFSFAEFALALNKQHTLSLLKSSLPNHPISEEVHQELLQNIREFFLVGGMPAVVAEFCMHRSFLELSRVQDLLLATYRADFGKYATESEQKYLRLLFENIPSQIGHHFKYSTIDPHIRSRELKTALNYLQMAGLIHFIFSSSASGLPLAMQAKPNKFKTLFLDIGLVHRALQIDPELILSHDLLQLHRGAVAEQFVGQELLAYSDFFREEQLFFWEREKQTSSAEIDYVIALGQHMIPIEVKAGAQGHLKSLLQFMKEKKSPLGLRISARPLSYQDSILSVPFYMIQHIPRLVKHVLKEM